MLPRETTMTTITTRPMEPADLEHVMTIQNSAYDTRFHERREVYAEKLRLFPRGCWIAEADGHAVGYLFSHPWRLDMPPALNVALDELPQEPDCYYIHDVAVDRSRHLRGIGQRLARQAQAIAVELGLRKMALIAIQNAQPFWQRFGFQAVETLSPLMEAKLASYGAEARFMVSQSP